MLAGSLKSLHLLTWEQVSFKGGVEGNTPNFNIIKSNLPRPACTYRRHRNTPPPPPPPTPTPTPHPPNISFYPSYGNNFGDAQDCTRV